MSLLSSVMPGECCGWHLAYSHEMFAEEDFVRVFQSDRSLDLPYSLSGTGLATSPTAYFQMLEAITELLPQVQSFVI